MSHIVTIQTQVRDEAAVRAACVRLGLAEPAQGKAQLFTAVAEGLVVQLPGWQYPVVCDLAAGTLRFDNFEGSWGEQSQLDRFLQAYAVEKTRLEAHRQGHSVTEQALADGSIKLTVQLQGGAG